MSIENLSGNYPEASDTLKPMERLILASINAIDEKGVERTDRNGVFHQADWDDDSLGLRYVLQRRRLPEAWAPISYSLQVHQQFSHDGLLESYKYDTLFKHVRICDKNGQPIDKKHSDHMVPALLAYLSSSRERALEDESTFFGMIEYNRRDDPRFGTGKRSFASKVLGLLRK